MLESIMAIKIFIEVKRDARLVRPSFKGESCRVPFRQLLDVCLGRLTVLAGSEEWGDVLCIEVGESGDREVCTRVVEFNHPLVLFVDHEVHDEYLVLLLVHCANPDEFLAVILDFHAPCNESLNHLDLPRVGRT